MQNILIFGFGSFFKGVSKYRDIDILIIHPSSDYDSCKRAILYKQLFLSQIDKVSVTMLSASEEVYFEFVNKSSAVFLGEIRENRFEEDILRIIDKIKNA